MPGSRQQVNHLSSTIDPLVGYGNSIFIQNKAEASTYSISLRVVHNYEKLI